MAKKTDFNAKVTEIEEKIPSISGLPTNLALTAVENKIPDFCSLVKTQITNTKISESEVNDYSHDKYITTPEFKTLEADVFKARLEAQIDLIGKPDFDSRLKEINDRVFKNKTKHLLVENELKNYKNLMLLISEVKFILKKMVHKIIYFFSQCTDILKGLQVFAVVIIYTLGNLKVCLMKSLILLLHLTIKLLQN